MTFRKLIRPRSRRSSGVTSRLDLPTKAIDKVKAQGGTRMYDVIYSICEEEMMAPASDII